ncbi:hypothetical protein AUJ17_04025 [Candidatus Micrarchaeota archaeon CG1_02_47_40]|nr:MAG: hypothetical protein AUJ17_04025 [Candidatus Micrarchaeota archaeon CG1_02_47_40]
MAANFFSSRPLLIWSKIELKELFASVFIIISVLTVMSASDVFISATTGVPGTSIQSTAEAHLDFFIISSVSAYNYLAEFSFYISKLASFSYSVSKPLIIFYTNTYYMKAPAAGLSVLSPPIYSALDNLSKITYAFQIQKLLLAFFSNTIPTLLLPIAFVLRAFPLTRKIGGTLIAVCLGAYLWFPAGIIFAKQTYSEYYPLGSEQLDMRNMWSYPHYQNILEDANPGNPPSAGAICSKTTALFISLGEGFWSLVTCAPLLLIPGAQGAFEICRTIITYAYLGFTQAFPGNYGAALHNYASLSREQFLSDYYNPLIQEILPPLAALYVNSLLSLLITIIVTIIMTRATSSAIGGDAMIYGISKLV